MPLRRSFDLVHLTTLHGWLFQDIYDWAGAIRNVAITKGSSVFANPRYIEEQARALFAKLHSESLLRHVSVENLPARLASYYGDLNTLHPFREGNGRAQRLLFRQLLGPRGLRLNWTGVTSDEKIRGCIASYNGDDAPLAALFERILEAK
jgi:cell filamentation protein